MSPVPDSFGLMPVHDEDGTPRIVRSARLLSWTRGMSDEDDPKEPTRRYLWIAYGRSYGITNFHTTDGPVSDVYLDPKIADDWELSVVDLDADDPVRVAWSRKEATT